MTQSLRHSALVGLGLVMALVSAGCGSTTAFSDASSIKVQGTPPAPPPPPPEAKPEPPPPPKPKRVEVTADQIVIHDKILFEVNKAVIRTESHALCDEIAQVIKDNPQIKQLSIEGHTDSDGGDKYNQSLSDKRAAAVMQYLVDHGIPQERLTSKGFGESKPLADNATAEGKEKNRRVEFIITAQDEVKKTYEIDPETGEKREVKKHKKHKKDKKDKDDKGGDDDKGDEKADKKDETKKDEAKKEKAP